MATQKKSASNSGRDNFDNLAHKISKDERKKILENYKIDENLNFEGIEEKAKKKDINPKQQLINNYNKEGMFQKFFIWLKSVFFNSSIEDVYNTNVVSRLGHAIEREYAGLIDFKHKTLNAAFYNKLNDLKTVQDFFIKYIQNAEKNIDSFYINLGSLVMSEIEEMLIKETDPFQYPLTSELSDNTRAQLLNKMDEIFAKIPADKKTKMYNASHAFEWIRAFSKLPITKFMQKFSGSSIDKKCSFVQAKSEFAQYVKLLNNQIIVGEEVFHSIFISESGVKNLYNEDEIDITNEVNGFIEAANRQISYINMFITSIPIKSLAKVIYDNAIYESDVFGGNENWLQKYRDEWKILFDKKWRQWHKEYKKEIIKQKLKIFFNMPNFMPFPYHTWDRVKDIAPFHYEYSMGFLNYFFKKEFVQYAGYLNLVTLEGDFSVKDNRREFNDTLDELNRINNEIEILINNISVSGSIGAEFAAYEGETLNESSKEKYKVLIEEIEDVAKDCISTFSKCSQSCEKLIPAMLNQTSDAYYGPLTNLNKIMGRENRVFKEYLEKFRFNLKNASDILAEMHDIDQVIQ